MTDLVNSGPVAVPASPGQQRLWFLGELNAAATRAYNVCVRIDLRGTLDQRALQAALNTVVDRHEALRTGLRTVEGRLLQVIVPSAAVTLRSTDTDAEDLPRLLAGEARRGWHLARPPLMRALLARLDPAHHVLALCVHHAVCDGLSLQIVADELLAAYRAHAAGQPPALAEVELHFADFVGHAYPEPADGAPPARKAAEKYWEETLAGAPRSLDLPTDRARPAQPSFSGGQVPVAVPAGLTADLRAWAARNRTTLAGVFLAAYAAVLSRNGGTDDLLIGLPVANRDRPELAGVVGYLANTCPVRADLRDDPDLGTLARRMGRAVTGLLPHAHLPFSDLVKSVGAERTLDRNPLFQVMLSLQQEATTEYRLPDLTAEVSEVASGTARLDLALFLVESASGGCRGVLEYSDELFERSTAERLVRQFLVLLERLSAEDPSPVSVLPLSRAEEGQESARSASPPSAPERDLEPHAAYAPWPAVLRRAESRPDLTAVVADDGTLTYRELVAAVRETATALQAAGIRPGDRVGVHCHRGRRTVVALLACWCASAVYVPVAPDLPVARRTAMLTQAGVRSVLCDAPDEVPPPFANATLPIALAADSGPGQDFPGDRAPQATAPAYVMFTSGTTGRPKPVLLSHGNLAVFLEGLTSLIGLAEKETLLALTTTTFDISLLELLGPLVTGGTVHVAGDDVAADGATLAALLSRPGVTTAQATPAVWRLALDGGWRPPAGFRILCGGEALPADLAEELTATDAQVWNLYGPTETTIWSCAARLTPGSPVTIGSPIPGTAAVVVDTEMRPVPPGICGELLIGGRGVGLGYPGHPGATAERFLPDPWRPGLLYRTGDIVRRRPDGRLEFVGRTDDQVKVRGHRLEPAEVESALRGAPGVDACAVTVAGQGASARVVAHIVPAPGAAADQAWARTVREHAAQTLPEAVVPAELYEIDRVPLTPHGKVDRRALAGLGRRMDLGAEYTEPRTELERRVADIWRDLLGTERVGVHDDFFLVGGHSMLAAQLVQRIDAELGVRLPVKQLYLEPTVDRIAAAVARGQGRLDGTGSRAQAPVGDASPDWDFVPGATPWFDAELHRAVADFGATAAHPLSVEQRRAWLLEDLGGAQAGVRARFRLEEPLDFAEAQRNLGALVAAEEALRSVFTEVAGVPVRLVLPTADIALFRGGPDAAAFAHIAEEPFSTSTGPLLRAVLSEGGTELLLVGHRLLFDETSLEHIAAAVSGAPRAAAARLSTVLAQRREWLAGHEARAEAAEWAAREQRPAATEIPPPVARPAVRGARRSHAAVDRAGLPLQAVDTRLLTAAALAAWHLVLMRHCGLRTARSGLFRPRPDSYGPLLGALDEMRPVQTSAEGGTIAEVLRAALAELDHTAPRPPLAYLLERHPPKRDLSRAPSFQTQLRVVDARPRPQGAGRGPRPLPEVPSATDADVALLVHADADVLRVRADFDADLYTEAFVRGVLDAYLLALEAVLQGPAPEAGVEDLPLLAPQEQERVLAAGRGPRRERGPETVVHLIGERARTTPQATAVRCRGAGIDYATLWDRASVVAAILAEAGVAPGDRVAVMMRRTPDALAAAIGTMRAGAVHVPIDPAHPRQRVEYLLDDCAPRVVLTESAATGGWEPPGRVLRLDQLTARPAGGAPFEARPEGIACLIYTSGSSGAPKGVEVPHAGLLNNIAWRQETWGLTREDRVLHNHAFTFDPSLWALLWPLTAGAAVVLASDEEMGDPVGLIRLLRDEGVSVLGGVPSLIGALAEHPAAGECSRIRLVLTGGEALPEALITRVRGRWLAEVAQLYGPTEATIDGSAYRIPLGAAEERLPAPVPIGGPLANTQIHVVDSELRPVPDGVVGEIVLGGAGVARGYHRRPGLTAERFLPDPFGPIPGARLYRTGDLGRRLPDGAVQFLGRVDDQVKVRGYRVELGEVDAALTSRADIREAACVVLDAGSASARLAAAIVAEEEAGPAAEGFRAALRASLPAHMVPDVVETVSELPRTPHGKVDRAAIAALFSTPTTSPVRTAPRDEVEREVADLFCDVLGLDEIDVHTGFFEAGGTSISIARLTSVLVERLGVEIPLHEFFKVPTVAGVAEVIGIYRKEGMDGVLARKHSATLEADGRLDAGVSPDGLPHANWTAPNRVLLTGATGYLGLHLLEELLLRTDAEVVCLCRARDDEAAQQRIVEGLRGYGIDVGRRIERVRCLAGDLGEPRLGLAEQKWNELAETVDAIYHNGALVNFVYPYSALKEPNVVGTHRIIELACTRTLKAVHYVSTIDTLLATHSPRPFLENDAPLHSAVGVPAGYTGSKWAAEKVVNMARERGIPVTIFRPGLIMGHTRSGVTQTTDYLLVALRGYLAMGVVPDFPRILDSVPVDYTAQAIVHISLQSDSLGEFYHVFNPRPIPTQQFAEWVRTYGYEFDTVPFEEGRRRALEVGPAHPLYPIAPLVRDASVETYRALDPRYIHETRPEEECANTLRQLAGSGISCPPIDESMAHSILRYLEGIGFLPSPTGEGSSANGRSH
ncbi:amino acid adenylation domain-containing protein [Marinactinospora thermotolerans]|uniref:amino acid adenylation domain-containing protein n=1 Tax=Marinactinospora thermotolerans TaxID=531310 RepID=UPI003D94D77B